MIGCDLHAGLQQALSAMRHGSREPSASRNLHELSSSTDGRFQPLLSAVADLHKHGAYTRRTHSVTLRLSVRSQAHTSLSRSASRREHGRMICVLVNTPLLFVG